MTVTQVGLWALFIVFTSSAVLQATYAALLHFYGGDRPRFWVGVAALSAGMAALYIIEVFRLRSVEANLPWILIGAAVWVTMMGVVTTLDALARFRKVVVAQRQLYTAVKRSQAPTGE